MAYLIMTQRPYPVWSQRIAPFFALLAALMFGIGDPLGRIARIFSPDEIRLLLFLIIVHLSLRWFAVGGSWRLFPLMALMGVMAAETPFGFLLPPIFILGYWMIWRGIVDGFLLQPDFLPEPGEMPKWRMLFLFLGSLSVSVWLNASAFISLGGIEAHGWQLNDIYFRYVGGYAGVMTGAATIIGWVLGLCFGVLPLFVVFRIFPLCVRDDRPMPFNLGVMMFFVGIMSLMQTGAFPTARFWTFTREVELVQSGFLLAFFHCCSMIAAGLSCAAFAFECQRKYLAPTEKRPGIALKSIVLVLFLGVTILAFTHVDKPVEKEMQRIVDEAIAETVSECGDAEFIFTDGRLDAALELEAANRGKTLRALNMMSGADEWEKNVRLRGFEPESDDAKSVEIGVPTLLRIWAGEKPHGLDHAALQLGFEFWKREKKQLPTLSGLVAREKGISESEAKHGQAVAKKLAERILAISQKAETADPSPALANAFSAVSWRLSRFARLRSDEEIANELDLSNTALKKMLSIIEYERLRTFMQLTPREGLELALKRADFVEARRYSAAVLRNDEDDPEANFGMGMAAVISGRYQEAERYLLKVLKRRPNEPATLNNLSIVFRKQRRYKEAEQYARKALKLLPDSAEVKRTLADALKKAP